jgi:hypothetical protein
MILWRSLRKRPAFSVAVITLLIAMATALLLGVRLGGDSSRYLQAGEHILSSPWPGKSASYAGYVLIVALSRPVGLVGLVALQVLAAAVASIALFDIGRQLSGVVAGLAGGLLFAVNIKIASWHSYVLTDSMYISFVVITVWAVHRAIERRTAAAYATGTVVTVFTASLRPTGWILLPVVASYWVWRRTDSALIRSSAIAAIAVAFGVMVLTVPLLARGVSAENPTRMLYEGRVQWAPEEARMPMPVADKDDDSLAAGVRYLAQHPVESARLALARVVRSLTAARPYFSTIHNWAIIAYLTPVYMLAILGSSRVWRQPLFGLTAAVVVAHMAIVAATFADYDGRFLLYVLPLMITLAGVGVSQIMPPRWIASLSGTNGRDYESPGLT